MYLVNESSKHEPVKRVYKTREKSQSLLDHPRTGRFVSDLFGNHIVGFPTRRLIIISLSR